MKLIRKALESLQRAVERTSGVLSQAQRVGYASTIPLNPSMPRLLREAAAEGAVLLENRLLPLAPGTRISLFGRNQVDAFYTGYGSGGDVNAYYTVNFLDGLRRCPELRVNEALARRYEAWCREHPIDPGLWGLWPRHYPQMPLTDDQVHQAAGESDVAVIILGRASGEDRDGLPQPGSYYLTADEKKLLGQVTGFFSQTVVLMNTGAVTDFSWMDEFDGRIGALCLLWQGGMESGNAAADLLCGRVNPSGRLTATVARSHRDYPAAASFGGRLFNTYTEDIYVGYRWFETFSPEQVRYPFGWGLSYTRFERQMDGALPGEDGVKVTVTVTNRGECPGKDACCLYLQKPQGQLDNPVRELAAFAKTRLLAPGESQVLCMHLPWRSFCSFDTAGVTGFPRAFVMEAGRYRLYLGGDVRSAGAVWQYDQPRTRKVESCSRACAPAGIFSIVKPLRRKGRLLPQRVAVIRKSADLKKRILGALPPSIPQTPDRGIRLDDVRAGRARPEDFVAQLSLTELEALTRGDYTMNSPLGALGNAGVFGGVLPSLREKGIPPVTATDGPSGIRLAERSCLIPIGTALACSFNTDLMERVYRAVGNEMRERGSHVLLAPAMNIQRHPLGGRNFEYFSEDPLLTGEMGAAAVRGLTGAGVAACPKHFACNNQEYNRTRHDSRLSQRALREIYLRGFELCVKQTHPPLIMTAYNKLNGVWSHYHYELCTTILRGEWGFDGAVMTDWWMMEDQSPHFPGLRNNGYRIRAQVDLLMPGGKRFGRRRPDGTLLKTYGRKNGITLGEIQRSALNILGAILRIPALDPRD